jgi:glycosyltransferase involved in cell wall biosynthesis
MAVSSVADLSIVPRPPTVRREKNVIGKKDWTTLQTLKRKISSAFRFLSSHGVLGTPHVMTRKVAAQPAPVSPIVGGIDIFSQYSFVNLPPATSSLSAPDVPPRTINWFIPPIIRASGGYLNIFRFIDALERMGYVCRIVIVGSPPNHGSANDSRREIAEWYFPVNAEVFFYGDDVPAAYYTFATAWWTAYWVRAFAKTVHRCYFVQDFEPLFYSSGSECCFAEDTYRFDFIGITAGDWLKEKLATEYSMRTHSFGFSYDKDLYTHNPDSQKTSNEAKRVFFYARPTTTRRAFELGLLALGEVAKRIPSMEVVFAGGDLSAYSIPFRHKDLGVLSLKDLPPLYQQCHAALVISLTNLSLLPLELMACGVPIISNNGASVEWMLNDRNSCLAMPNPTCLARAIFDVLSDENLASRLRQAGLSFTQTTDWDDEARKIAAALDEYCDTASLACAPVRRSAT